MESIENPKIVVEEREEVSQELIDKANDALKKHGYTVEEGSFGGIDVSNKFGLMGRIAYLGDKDKKICYHTVSSGWGKGKI